MKSLRDSIYINDAIYQRLDAGEKSLIQILALTIPSSAFVAFIVFFFSINLLLDSVIIALIGSAFAGYLFYVHDSTLLSESGTGRAYFRLFSSMVMAIVMAVPLKVTVVGDDLTDIVLQEIKTYNMTIDQDLQAAKQIIYEEEKEMMDKITEAGKTYAQTRRSQELVEARRAKETFDKQKEERMAALEKSYDTMKKSEKVGRLDLAAYYFTNMFSPRSPKEFFINLSVFFLLLLFESMPAIIRLRLEDSNYLSKINHGVSMQHKTDYEVESLEKEMLNADAGSLGMIRDKIEKIRIWKALEKASKDGFKDTEQLYRMADHFARKAEQPIKKDVPPPPPPPKSIKKTDMKPMDEFFDFKY